MSAERPDASAAPRPRAQLSSVRENLNKRHNLRNYQLFVPTRCGRGRAGNEVQYLYVAIYDDYYFFRSRTSAAVSAAFSVQLSLVLVIAKWLRSLPRAWTPHPRRPYT